MVRFRPVPVYLYFKDPNVSRPLTHPTDTIVPRGDRAMMTKIQKGMEIELDVEKLAFGGKAIARHEGMVVFLDGAAPGQRVVARVVRKKKQMPKLRSFGASRSLPASRALLPPLRCVRRLPVAAHSLRRSTRVETSARPRMPRAPGGGRGGDRRVHGRFTGSAVLSKQNGVHLLRPALAFPARDRDRARNTIDPLPWGSTHAAISTGFSTWKRATSNRRGRWKS